MTATWRYFLFLATVFPLCANVLFAQEGILRGKITEKGSVKPVANATLSFEEAHHQATTNANGEFVLLGIWPGTYSARVSAEGYGDLVMTDIRIHAVMTTTVDFELAAGTEQLFAFSAETAQTSGQTGTVRLLSKEYIKNLPVRGLENLLKLEPGVVEKNGTLHVRGGETGELSFFVNGVTATNALVQNSAMTIEAIPEAIEEVQLYTGAFGAEFGHANSALVQTILRTGGSDFNASFDYRTDDFAKPGEQFLGTSSFGYCHAVATIGGPLGNTLRYFVAAQHNYLRNRTISFVEPFRFDNLTDDGLSGRTAGEPLPGPLLYERNYLPHNWLQNNSVQGNFVFDANAFKFRLTAGYTHDKRPLGRDTFTQSLSNYFNLARSRENTTKTGLVALRAIHSLSSSTFYTVNLHYSNRSFESADPDFGSDWMSYSDREKVAALGYNTTNWVGRFNGPLKHSTIFNFQITPLGTPNNSYEKNRQSNLGLAADFTSLLNKNWQIKAGMRFDRWKLRGYSANNITAALIYLYGIDGTTPRQFPSPEVRAIELANRAAINYLGYDVDGKEIDSGLAGPRQPDALSFYLQNQYQIRQLLLNLGLRYERIASDIPVLTNSEFDPVLGFINESIATAKSSNHFLPRFSLALPLREQTLFYASFGKYIEPFTGFGFGTDPERQTKYELGLRQQFGKGAELNGVFFSRTDKLSIQTLLGEGDFSNDTRGLEFNLDLPRYRHLTAQLRYTLTDRVDGQADNTRVVVSDDVILQTPVVIFENVPLPSHRGTVLLDYRFAKNEGGKVLGGLGINAIFSFDSGYNYTQIAEPLDLGQASPWNVGIRSLVDPRNRNPLNSLETAKTPSNFQIDLGVIKAFDLAGANVEIYVHALNLLNTKHVLNVYPTTGEPDDDGWLSNPLSAQHRAIPNYEAFYRAINLDNRWAYTLATGNDIYGQPRQLRLGLRLGL